MITDRKTYMIVRRIIERMYTGSTIDAFTLSILFDLLSENPYEVPPSFTKLKKMLIYHDDGRVSIDNTFSLGTIFYECRI